MIIRICALLCVYTVATTSSLCIARGKNIARSSTHLGSGVKYNNNSATFASLSFRGLHFWAEGVRCNGASGCKVFFRGWTDMMIKVSRKKGSKLVLLVWSDGHRGCGGPFWSCKIRGDWARFKSKYKKGTEIYIFLHIVFYLKCVLKVLGMEFSLVALDSSLALEPLNTTNTMPILVHFPFFLNVEKRVFTLKGTIKQCAIALLSLRWSAPNFDQL